MFGYEYVSVDIPDENATVRQEANVYYWADGTQMVSVGAVNRQNVTLSSVPASMENAVISAENATFYSDSGVSFTGIARALVGMARGQDVQGGSTITQQYVKNSYLSQEQTLERKLSEFFIALKLGNQESKRHILQGYLNTSFFGRGANGVQTAARAYFGIDAKDLNPSQSALLAATLKGPEQYDPTLSRANHERARARWKWILDRQVQVGLMSRRERAKYRTFPEPRKESKSTSLAGQTGYLVDLANRYVKKRANLTDQAFARGGYKIYTTFEKDKVKKLKRAVESHQKGNIAPGKRPQDRFVQVGAASVRPADGAIVAVYGGEDATKRFTNNADTAGVPVGSAFKPFVLAAGLQYGVSATSTQGRQQAVFADSFYDSAGILQTGSPVPRPTDPAAGSQGSGTSLTFRQALVQSANLPFVQLGRDVGLERVERLATQVGLLKRSMAPLDEATFPLGFSTPSSIRMASAYATFGNNGTRAEPYSVTKVLRGSERLKGFGRPRPRSVLASTVASSISNVLQDVGRNSLGTAAGIGPFSAAGTSPKDTTKSAWFVGYNQHLSTAVTVFRQKSGAPNLLPMDGVGGVAAARGDAFPSSIWATYMGTASTTPVRDGAPPAAGSSRSGG